MASSKDNLKALVEQRDRLAAELDALTHKIAGIDLAIEVVGRSVKESVGKRFSLKTFILDLLKDRGFDGLNANIAVELAAKNDIDIDRSSVASLLSRLKNEGTVVHDGNLYRLKEFFRPREASLVHQQTANETITRRVVYAPTAEDAPRPFRLRRGP